MTLVEANSANLWFLALVALWRLALWVWYLARHCQLSGWRIFVATTMPVTVIFLALVALNLHHVVFNIMGGIREADKSSQDAAYAMLNLLLFLSVPVCAVACCAWLGIVLGTITRSSRSA
jgi:xanthine/uracil permease